MTEQRAVRPLRQRFDSNIKVHYDLEDLHPGMRLQYRRLLLVVSQLREDGFRAMVLLENGHTPSGSLVRDFGRHQLARMRRPPTWLLHQLEETYAHD